MHEIVTEIDRLAGEAGLGRAWDAALPHTWVMMVRDETGLDVRVYGMVWSYADGSIFGRPYALTDEARAVLDQLPEHLR